MSRRLAVTLAILGASIAACVVGSTDRPGQFNGESVIVGESRTEDEATCESVTGVSGRCSRDTREIFNEFQENIDDYVNGGQLGPLNSTEFSFQDVAYAGMMACTYQARSESLEDYLTFMSDDETLTETVQRVGGNEDRTFRGAWFEAKRTLCPSDSEEGTNVTDSGRANPIPGGGVRQLEAEPSPLLRRSG